MLGNTGDWPTAILILERQVISAQNPCRKARLQEIIGLSPRPTVGHQMIKSVRIKNFKCLLDVKVNLEPFTVLIGPNDSGKTSFLNAIQVLGLTAKQNLSEVLPSREKRKRGFAAKVASAIALSEKYGCRGTICVADRDRDEDRLPAMEEGKTRGMEATDIRAVACGVAVESIEAWLLAVPEAIAQVLRQDVKQVMRGYKLGHVEELYQSSGKLENRPKDLLARIAQSADREDTLEFRLAVAESADLATLEGRCKKGFQPFAQEIRMNIAPACG